MRDGKIQCRECGRFFSFLAPHLHKRHGMSCREYRERWQIPLWQPLAGREHSQRCRENILKRIGRGEIIPSEQIALMKEALKAKKERNTSTELHKRTARQTAALHRIWESSPVVKRVPEVLREEAVRRMAAREVSGESVKDIAGDLELSVSFVYRWYARSKTS